MSKGILRNRYFLSKAVVKREREKATDTEVQEAKITCIHTESRIIQSDRMD
jgi:hypothetical protein